MNDESRGYSIFKVIGVRTGKHIRMAKKVSGSFEVFNKRDSSHLGNLIYDNKWKCFVWVDQPSNIQMSEDCLIEAFKIAKEWK